MTVIPIAPSAKYSAITPSDTIGLSYNSVVTPTKAIYVGGAGDIAMKNSLGTSVTYQNVPAGSILPIEANFIMATNTTATLLIGIF